MAHDPIPNSPPLDASSLRTRCLDDAAFVKEILELFREQSAVHLANLRNVLAAGDAQATWKVAHGLKGSAANLSADRLSQLCYEAEQCAQGGAMDQAAALLDPIQSEFDRCVAYFPTLLAMLQAK